MVVNYSNEPMHLGIHSERRRGTVLLCDHDRVLPHWLVTDDATRATCPTCQRLEREGVDALTEMQRIRNHSQVEQPASSLSQDRLDAERYRYIVQHFVRESHGGWVLNSYRLHGASFEEALDKDRATHVERT